MGDIMYIQPIKLFLYTFFLIIFIIAFISPGSASTGRNKNILYTKFILNKYGYVKIIINTTQLNRILLDKFKGLNIRILKDNNNYIILVNFNLIEFISKKYTNLFTYLEENDHICYNYTISSFLDLIKLVPGYNVLERSKFFSVVIKDLTIYIPHNRSYIQLKNATYLVPKDMYILERIPAFHISSSLGLPRVSVLINPLSNDVSLYDYVKLRLSIINASIYKRNAGITIPSVIVIRARYLRPLKVEPITGQKPRVLYMDYMNNTGIVALYYDKASVRIYDDYIVFIAEHSGITKILVNATYITPLGNISVKRFAAGGYPCCGCVTIEPIQVHRYSTGYPWFFTLSVILMLLLTLVYIIFTRKRG